jgi:hypothetical protein
MLVVQKKWQLVDQQVMTTLLSRCMFPADSRAAAAMLM